MLRAWLVKLFLALLLGAVSQANAAPAPVGRIALSVGEAKRVDTDGKAAPLRLGTPISEGDRIITGGDAVAIIVFVDEGRISLRADSELLVKQYKVDPAGLNSHLDLELVRGAIRQISGQAARMQPERYRLNTPIASIGVRGTDFLAKTSSDAVETFVQEGKIVVLSNLTACVGLAQTGNCAPLADISATDSARYLRVLAGGQIERRVVAADEIERLFGISLVKVSAATPAATPAPVMAKAPEPVKLADVPAKPTGITESFSQGLRVPDDAGKPSNSMPVAAATLNDLKTVGSQAPAAPVVVVTPPAVVVTPPAVVVAPPPVVVTPPVVVVTPPVAPVVEAPPVAVVTPPVVVAPPALVLNNTPDLSRQLVWGRFSSADQLPLQLWVPYDTAKDGRSVTVGELGQYALWRTGPTQSISSSLKGEVQFDIRSGEAYYQNGSQVLAAQISNPALSINFDKATFSSSLTVSQAQIGSSSLQMTGKMNDEGVFSARSASQMMAGAVSLNGKEAGLLFSSDYAGGAFKGITLWNAR
jgi:FecR protein